MILLVVFVVEEKTFNTVDCGRSRQSGRRRKRSRHPWSRPALSLVEVSLSSITDCCHFVPQCKVMALRAFYYVVCIVEKTCA